MSYPANIPIRSQTMSDAIPPKTTGVSMDIERTMEFIPKQQARFETSFDRSHRRMDRIERVLKQRTASW